MTEPVEIQQLRDQIELLELDLECARRNENNVNYWYGQDDGVRGACLRWQEALTNPVPKPGIMQEPLEKLYRQTEALRQDLDRAQKDLLLVRGQRDGYASMIVHVFHDIAHYWHPRKGVERAACDQVLDRLGACVKATLEATEAARGN